MKRLLPLLATAAMCVSLLFPAILLASDDEAFEEDARYAEGTPPMVPHPMEPGATGDACLACHLEGKGGAPVSPHAVRLDCVECHAQGEIREKKPHKKDRKHMKSRGKE